MRSINTLLILASIAIGLLASFICYCVGHNQGMDDAAAQGCLLHDSRVDVWIHEFTGQ